MNKQINKLALSTKSIFLSSILISFFGFPEVYSAEPQIFGRAHLSVGTISEGDNDKNTSSSITSHASRFGVKGSIISDSDVKVIYRIVWQVDMTDNANSSEDHLKSREQFVGLEWQWGKIHIGRDDSPYKLAGKTNVEYLSDTWADYNNIIDKNQDTRNDDSIGYWAKIGSGELGVQYAAGDDEPDAENLGDSWSIAYDFQVDLFSVALAYQNIENTFHNAETGSKIVLGYQLGRTQLGYIYEKVNDDNIENNNIRDQNNSLISVKHSFDDKNALKLTYGVKDQTLVKDARMIALAYDHKMGKQISTYLLLAKGFDNGLRSASGIAGDGSVLVVGVIADF